MTEGEQKKISHFSGKREEVKLEVKMRRMLLSTMVPMSLLLIVLLAFFWQYTKKYNELSQNLAMSSEFNVKFKDYENEYGSDMNFKDYVDLYSYYVAIGSKDKDALPVSTVEDAIDVINKLKENSVDKGSERSLRNLTAYLENLKKRMLELTEIEKYDDRIVFMDNNIRILTSLIVTEMQNYTYQEAMNLVEVESRLAKNGRMMILTMCVIVLITILLLMRRSFRFSYDVTEPITQILVNVRKVGRGEFREIVPTEADSLEIRELDAGMRKMAIRIEGLLENVRKEQEMQHLTQLQLIQAQVNPHFLYNTLDTIVWLIEGGQEQDAVDMITSLSVFFRTSLSKGNDIIPLSEEMRHTLSYLEIQRSRYRDIMEFEIKVPKELDTILVPKLTLQPLAENALYHGIKNKRGKGKILIEGFDLGDDILLRVSDNGQGMTSHRLAEVQQAIQTGERAGFGLAAVSERIRLYYGLGYGLKISSKEGEGTVMEVYLAKKLKNDNDKIHYKEMLGEKNIRQ